MSRGGEVSGTVLQRRVATHDPSPYMPYVKADGPRVLTREHNDSRLARCRVWDLGLRAAVHARDKVARALGGWRRRRGTAATACPPLPVRAVTRAAGCGVDAGIGDSVSGSVSSRPSGGDASCSSTASTAVAIGSGRRRQGGAVGAAGATAKLRERPQVDSAVDGVLVRQPEDGSCLFHSIAHGLRDGTGAEDLRLQIARCIGETPTLQIANTTITEWVRLTAGVTTSEYQRELEDRGTWGGALEIAVAAQLKGIVIDVYEREESRFRRITSFGSPSASRTVNIVYQTQPVRHYDAFEVVTTPASPAVGRRDDSHRF